MKRAESSGTDFMKKESIRIIVAAHKPYWMPRNDIYVPVLVGAAQNSGDDTTKIGYQPDSSGDNISQKNAGYCELTGLYWAWKNMDAEIYGLCHYRRYLGSRQFRQQKKDRILQEAEIRKLLSEHDLILPRKRHYWIETRGSQYAHAHHQEDLELTEKVLAENYPENVAAWKHMLQTRSGHICNMFIMRKELFTEYCDWLFDVLFEVERRLDISGYSDKDRRVFGYLGERLLDVWIESRGLTYAEVPMINLEKQNWGKKGLAFLGRKLKALKK